MVVPSRKDVFYRPCAHPRLFCSTRFFWTAAMDRKLVYRIDDGIPVLLVEEAIGTGQVADFPKA